jgi:hypothetical protein
MLPATTLEKYLTVLFYCLVLFVPIFTVLYSLTGFIFVKISWPAVTMAEIIERIGRLYSARVFLDLLIAFLLVQSITIAGVIHFRKQQFLVAVPVMILIFFFYTIASYFIVKSMTGIMVITWLLPFYNYGFGFVVKRGTQLSFDYFHFKGLISYLYPYVWITASLIIYIGAWSKLREREL